MKKINILSVILFFLIIILTFCKFSGLLIKIDIKYCLFVLLTLFSVSMIVGYIIIYKPLSIGYYILKTLLMLIGGFISAIIIGSQTHYVREVGMGIGVPIWMFFLGYIYPVAFGIFIYCLGKLDNKVLSLIFLIIWELIVGLTGYVFTEVGTSKLDEDFDSDYFQSGSSEITPILLIAVGLMIVVHLVRIIRNE